MIFLFGPLILFHILLQFIQKRDQGKSHSLRTYNNKKGKALGYFFLLQFEANHLIQLLF